MRAAQGNRAVWDASGVQAPTKEHRSHRLCESLIATRYLPPSFHLLQLCSYGCILGSALSGMLLK